MAYDKTTDRSVPAHGAEKRKVCAFNLDNDIVKSIQADAQSNKSRLVNELLREALEARAKSKAFKNTVLEFSEATSTLMVSFLILGLFVALV